MRIFFPCLVACLIPAATLAAPNVVVDTAVTGSLVQQVLGDKADVHILLPAGANAHHYQLSPADARQLQNADLLIWTGPGLTPWLERATNVLDRDARQLLLLDVPDTRLIEYGEGEDSHNHTNEHEHGNGHDHGPIDPHAWLDPQNAQIWVRAIAASLSETDPENAPAYEANADGAAESIGALDAAMAQKLAPLQDARFVVFHDAYNYFTRHFHLQPAIAVSEGDASTPSAKRIAALRTQIVFSGATCAFPEAGHDAKPINIAVEGSEVRVGAALDPEGTGQERGAGLYNALIENLAANLVDCLSNSD